MGCSPWLQVHLITLTKAQHHDWYCLKHLLCDRSVDRWYTVLCAGHAHMADAAWLQCSVGINRAGRHTRSQRFGSKMATYKPAVRMTSLSGNHTFSLNEPLGCHPLSDTSLARCLKSHEEPWRNHKSNDWAVLADWELALSACLDLLPINPSTFKKPLKRKHSKMIKGFSGKNHTLWLYLSHHWDR